MARPLLSRLFANGDGNVAIIAGLSAIPLVAAAGVAIDTVRAENLRTSLAAALDGAVLAGAVASTDNIGQSALFFDANFANVDATNIHRSFKKSASVKVEGSASAELEPALLTALGLGPVTVAVNATAETSQSAVTSDPALCILALSGSASQAFLANSGANVSATGCEIHVKSTGNPAAIFNAGTTINSAKLCLQGTKIIDNGGVHPNLQTGCKTLSDPYAGKVVAPDSSTCNFNNLNYSGKTTLKPGVYCGWHNFNSGTDVTLQPGTYVIKNGGWNVNGGTWTGTGVTFYYADTSKIQFNSAVNATLSAPKSGTNAGFLFAEKSGLSNSQFILDDNKGFDMEGIIYLPSRDVVFNSSTTVNSRKMTAVVNTVIFNGVKWNITAYDGSGSSGNAATVTARLIK